jgi:hypothetical protein
MSKFPELERIKELSKVQSAFVRSEVLSEVKAGDEVYPIHGFVIGSENKLAPTFGMFGGVHGLEKVGTHVALHHLESLITQLGWDEELQKRFSNCRFVSIPMLNPWGVRHFRRSNPNGVDLMRNAPIEAETKPPFLVGGQRYSNKLPWYRGSEDEMELESKTLVEFVKKEMFESNFSISLDLHSGFGTKDRLWYPYAKTKEDFPLVGEVKKFQKLFEDAFPNHIYHIEPQALSYTTHGDLWDYLFDQHYEKNKNQKIYIPWCLEMGSWMWVKKNPKQLFSALGAFNPILPHRYKRIMRRHYVLLDFFLRSTAQYRNWHKL